MYADCKKNGGRLLGARHLDIWWQGLETLHQESWDPRQSDHLVQQLEEFHGHEERNHDQ